EWRVVHLRQNTENEVQVETNQRQQDLLNEAPKQNAHGSRRRQAGQAREAAHEGVADQILQMLQSPGADVRQRHEQQSEPRTAVVTAERGAGSLQSARQREPAHVPAQQFEATVRRELLRNERNRQIPLDHLSQRAYAQTHQRGLLESESGVGTSTLLIRGFAPLMHFGRSFAPSVISDWG